MRSTEKFGIMFVLFENGLKHSFAQYHCEFGETDTADING